MMSQTRQAWRVRHGGSLRFRSSNEKSGEIQWTPVKREITKIWTRNDFGWYLGNSVPRTFVDSWSCWFPLEPSLSPIRGFWRHWTAFRTKRWTSSAHAVHVRLRQGRTCNSLQRLKQRKLRLVILQKGPTALYPSWNRWTAVRLSTLLRCLLRAWHQYLAVVGCEWAFFLNRSVKFVLRRLLNQALIHHGTPYCQIHWLPTR